MHRLLRFTTTLAVALMLGSAASALSHQRMSVIGCGGTVAHGHGCTIGQPVAGTAITSAHEHYAGFWYPLERQYAGVYIPTEPMPTDFDLRFAGANPAGSGGAVVFAMPLTGRVSIRLYDVTGRQVQELVDGTVSAGYHEVGVGSTGLDAGIYFCRMETRGFSAIRKLVLLR